MPQQVICHSCQKELDLEEKVGRQDTCPECNAYLRCCLNCRFYDTTAYNECRETSAERVVDKKQGSFCDYFEPGTTGAEDSSRVAGEAKKALEDLFKKS